MDSDRILVFLTELVFTALVFLTELVLTVRILLAEIILTVLTFFTELVRTALKFLNDVVLKVLDDGRKAQYAPPKELLEQKKGIFYGLYRASQKDVSLD
jgi:hypothetical protein